jgi:chemotaxis regulatin CheY-phosphate phosphatase CheZ
MSQNNLRQVMRRIRRTIYHLGVFDGSLSRMREAAPEHIRAYLIVLQDCLPDLKHLLRYAADTVPVIGRMMGLVDRGTSDLARASQILREVKRSTQQAVEEILMVLDRVNPLLDRVSKAEGKGSKTQQMLSEARGQLVLILNALQFQDITAQQIEATNAVLADLGKGLGALMEGLGEKPDGLPTIEVMEGTFDPYASFDRDRAGVDQEAIDRLLESNRQTAAAMPESRTMPGNGKPPAKAGVQAIPEPAVVAPASGGGEVVDQEAIDALLNGDQSR